MIDIDAVYSIFIFQCSNADLAVNLT